MPKKSNNKKPINKGGRPTDFKKEYSEMTRKLCLLGYTNEQLAEFFEVTTQTIHNWKKNHPEFFDALKQGKSIANANVAEAVYKRATGFSHQDEMGVVKYYPPDVSAGIFWLKNREPQIWRDSQEHKVEGEIATVPINKARIIAIKKALEDEI